MNSLARTMQRQMKSSSMIGRLATETQPAAERFQQDPAYTDSA